MSVESFDELEELDRDELAEEHEAAQAEPVLVTREEQAAIDRAYAAPELLEADVGEPSFPLTQWLVDPASAAGRRVRPWAMLEGEALAILRSLPDACVDALICDPPYSSGGQYRGDRTIAVWDKTPKCRPTMGRFAAQSEFIVWGSNGAMPFERGVGVLPGVFKYAVEVDEQGREIREPTLHLPPIEAAVDVAEKHHITGKPVELMRAINAIAVPGGVILDPFAGSASTGVAALRDGYRFLGIERVGAYVETGIQRLRAELTNSTLRARMAGQEPLFR